MNSGTGCPSRWNVEVYAVAIENAQPIEGDRDVQLNVLALVEHLKNFMWAKPNNIEFPVVSMFGYQHPPSLSHLRLSSVSVDL